MTKRIIDGMSPEQIVHGWNGSQGGIIEYLESICKPVPNWENDVSKGNPVLCWVSTSPLPNSDGTPYYGITGQIDTVYKEGYGYRESCGIDWKYARPISPNECWQPAKQGEADEDNA